MRRIRNHAEATIKSEMNLNNLIGYNFRLGEIECGIGIEQIKKLKKNGKKKTIGMQVHI